MASLQAPLIERKSTDDLEPIREQGYHIIEQLSGGISAETCVCAQDDTVNAYESGEKSDADIELVMRQLRVVKLPRASEILMKEYNALRSHVAKRHPRIPSIIDVDGRPAAGIPMSEVPERTFAIPLIEGASLKSIQEEAEQNMIFRTGMPEAFVWHVGIELMEILYALRPDISDDEGRPIMHMDIWEQNIMVTGEESLPEIHLIDFGCAIVGPLASEYNQKAYEFYNGDDDFRGAVDNGDPGVDYDFYMVLMIMHRLAHMYRRRKSTSEMHPGPEDGYKSIDLSEDEDSNEEDDDVQDNEIQDPTLLHSSYRVRPAGQLCECSGVDESGPFGGNDSLWQICIQSMKYDWKRPEMPERTSEEYGNKEGWTAWTHTKYSDLVQAMKQRRDHPWLPTEEGQLPSTWKRDVVSKAELKHSLESRHGSGQQTRDQGNGDNSARPSTSVTSEGTMSTEPPTGEQANLGAASALKSPSVASCQPLQVSVRQDVTAASGPSTAATTPATSMGRAAYPTTQSAPPTPLPTPLIAHTSATAPIAAPPIAPTVAPTAAGLRSEPLLRERQWLANNARRLGISGPTHDVGRYKLRRRR